MFKFYLLTWQLLVLGVEFQTSWINNIQFVFYEVNKLIHIIFIYLSAAGPYMSSFFQCGASYPELQGAKITKTWTKTKSGRTPNLMMKKLYPHLVTQIMTQIYCWGLTSSKNLKNNLKKIIHDILKYIKLFLSQIGF